MTMTPAALQDGTTGAERLLFTSGPRLGWVFRDRRQAITPYTEPEPDPQALATQLTTRLQRAERSWRFSLRWVARPLLPLALVLYAAGTLARDATHRSENRQARCARWRRAVSWAASAWGSGSGSA